MRYELDSGQYVIATFLHDDGRRLLVYRTGHLCVFADQDEETPGVPEPVQLGMEDAHRYAVARGFRRLT